MTNERMFGLSLRMLGVPVALLFLGFSGYCIFLFWQQEAVAKELYTWEPVVTTDYEIKRSDQPEWSTENLPENSEGYEQWLKELNTMQQAMHTTSVNAYTIDISYRYEYQGQTGEGFTVSPFPKLNQQALRDPQLHRYLLREDHPPLMVYVNPDHPERSALVRGWAQGDRWGALMIGGVLLPLSLAMLYFLVWPVRRVEEIFK